MYRRNIPQQKPASWSTGKGRMEKVSGINTENIQCRGLLGGTFYTSFTFSVCEHQQEIRTCYRFEESWTMKVRRTFGVLPMKFFCSTREDPEALWSISGPLIWELWSMTGQLKRITIYHFALFLSKWVEDLRVQLSLALYVCLKWLSFWIHHWPKWASHFRGKF